MSRPGQALAAALTALLAAACVSPTRTLGPGWVANDRFGFELLAPWSPIPEGRDPEVNAGQLTRAGPLLDRVFIASLRSGEGLVTPGFEAYPRWWSGTPSDALERFLVESLQALGYEQARVVSSVERPFGGGTGTLYSLALRRPGGLEIRGAALAGVEDETLDLLLFLAPAEHYFPARRSEVEHMFHTLTRAPEIVRR